MPKFLANRGGARQPTLGVNLPAPWMFSWPFAFLNVALACRWQTGSTSGTTLDSATDLPVSIASGTPTIAFECNDTQVARDYALDRDWVLTWEGGTVTWVPGAGITNWTVDGPNKRVTFRFSALGDRAIGISAISAPMTDLKLFRAEDEARILAGQIFNPDLVNVLRQCRIIRPLDWACVNAHCKPIDTTPPTRDNTQSFPVDGDGFEFTAFTLVSDWNTQREPVNTKVSISRTRGVPIEYQVALANEAMCDLWAFIPPAADDTYVTQFATYIRDNLHPDLRVKFEVGNEAWNPLFGSHFYFWEQSGGVWGDGETPMTKTPHRGYHERVASAGALINTVFSSQQSRCDIIVGGQLANDSLTVELIRSDTLAAEFAVSSYIANIRSGEWLDGRFPTWVENGTEEDKRAAIKSVFDGQVVGPTSGNVLGQLDAQLARVNTHNTDNSDDVRLVIYEGSWHALAGPGGGTDPQKFNRNLVIKAGRDWQDSEYSLESWRAWWDLHETKTSGPPLLFMLYGHRYSDQFGFSYPSLGENESGYWGVCQSPMPQHITPPMQQFLDLSVSRPPWWTLAGDTDRDMRYPLYYRPKIVETVDA